MHYLQTNLDRALAKNLAWRSANELLRDGQKAVDQLAVALGWAEQAGPDKGELAMLRGAMLDFCGHLQGNITRVLDNEGLNDTQHQLDLTELQS